MVWTGQGRTSQKAGGAFGGFERLTDGDYVVPRHAWFHYDGDNGHPDLAVHLEVRDGRPEVVEYRLTAKPGGRGLRSVDLGAFPLDNLALSVFVELALEVVDASEGAVTLEPVERRDDRTVWRVTKLVDDAVKAPQRIASPVELEQVAEVYRANLGRSPRQAVREALRYRSTSTAARRIKQARDAGLLDGVSDEQV